MNEKSMSSFSKQYPYFPKNFQMKEVLLKYQDILQKERFEGHLHSGFKNLFLIDSARFGDDLKGEMHQGRNDKHCTSSFICENLFFFPLNYLEIELFLGAGYTSFLLLLTLNLCLTNTTYCTLFNVSKMSNFILEANLSQRASFSM